jgi:UDP-2-acetamido-2,6-beta-L-arabino-hexul-4-ose reductase
VAATVEDPNPMRVLITGAEGLLGWHLRCRLHAEKSIAVIPCNRAAFADTDAFASMVRSADAIVHVAGVNRGDDGEIERTNIALAERIVEHLDRAGSVPHIIYASSIHEDRDTPYGRSKRRAGEILQRAGGVLTWLTLPHVFGEGGRPFYNSVVSTFCHQLARRETPRIQVDGDLELVHAQQVADVVLTQLQAREPRVRVKGVGLTVSELLARLGTLAAEYGRNVIPDLRDPFELRLFNTYRSYLFPQAYPVELDLRVDSRGELFEAVRGHSGGQTFLSHTRPGITRGNHYHRRKVERFLVIAGSARIRIRPLFRGSASEFSVSGEKPVFIDMPTFHTHNITNVGDRDLLTLFWTNEIFDPSDPDTFAEEV